MNRIRPTHNAMLGAILAMASYAASQGTPTDLRMGFPRFPEQKARRGCARKLCLNSTTHNGGFCSAECCKLDRQERKTKNQETT